MQMTTTGALENQTNRPTDYDSAAPGGEDVKTLRQSTYLYWDAGVFCKFLPLFPASGNLEEKTKGANQFFHMYTVVHNTKLSQFLLQTHKFCKLQIYREITSPSVNKNVAKSRQTQNSKYEGSQNRSILDSYSTENKVNENAQQEINK